MPASRPPAPRPQGGGSRPRSSQERSSGSSRAGRPSSGQVSQAGARKTSVSAGKKQTSPSASSRGAKKPPERPAVARKRASANSPADTSAKATQHTKKPASGASAYRTKNRAVGVLQSGTSRLVVLGLVVLMCASLLVPVVRNYMKQYNQLAELREQIQVQETINADLENQLERWQDDSYVIAQARERLTFVFPGEIPYRVMDSENAQLVQENQEQPVIKPAMKQPWYSTLWDSVQEAGSLDDAPGEDADNQPDDSDDSGAGEDATPPEGEQPSTDEGQ